ncbi:MAG: hypothetical protein HY553_10080 [Elusimicrobia bacterium]|nr:hypothetical protein [Elusimicrobiota bacterium]
MSDRRVLGALALLAVVARLAAQIGFGFYEHPESWEQDIVARNVAAGQGFQLGYAGTTFHALVAPAFPLLLAVAYVLLGTTAVAGGAAQLAIGATLTLTVALVALRAGLPRITAVLAGTLVALHPGLLVYSAKLHPLAFDALLAALLVFVLVALETDLGLRRIASLGALMGVIALERITLLPPAALALAAAASASAGRWRGAARAAALAGGIAALIVTPWVVRNAVTIGSPTIVTTGGLALWLGNNPVGAGGATLPGGVPVIQAVPEVRVAVWGWPETAQDAMLRSFALRYVQEDPWRALRNAAARFVAFWWAGPQTGVEYPASWTTLYLAYYAIVVALAALGVVELVRLRRIWLLAIVGSLALSVSLAHALTYVEGRHRWAIEPEILLLAAVGVTVLARGVRSRPLTTASAPRM